MDSPDPMVRVVDGLDAIVNLLHEDRFGEAHQMVLAVEAAWDDFCVANETPAQQGAGETKEGTT